MINPKIFTGCNFFTACSGAALAGVLLLASQAAYADIAGYVQFVTGIVQSTETTGQTRNLHKGDAVHESDTLTTAKTASTQIRMLDGGLIAIRPDSQFKIDSFRFGGKEDGTEQSFFSLLRGGIRAITGLIGHQHKQNYKIAALSTSIGIRGTDHETYVVLPGSDMAASVPPGTYNRVNRGETTMTTGKGSINILPNQMGYSGGENQMPVLQPVNLTLFTAVPPPAPKAPKNKATTPVRDSVVLDNAVLDQNTAPASILPEIQLQTPIKGNTVPTAPGQVF